MSFRYPAGLITASSPVNANYPSGVWTPRQALPYLQNGVWGQDPFFDQTVLLLHGDGTNGAQNNTFLDSSSNNFTITRNGNTTQGTFTPFSLAAGEWSNYFSGNGNYISANPSTAVDFGSGSFTLEAWVYLTSLSNSATIMGTRTGDTSATIRWVLYVAPGGNTLDVDIWNTANARIAYFSHQTALSLNTWYHVACVRNGTGFRLYVNGVQSTSSATSSDAVANSNTVVTIGQSNGGFSGTNAPLVGYISNARIVKGTAVYTSSFTPPTTPLTNITNTSLLTCQSNRFVDNSTNNFAITRNGDVRVTPFSPFQPLLAYSPGVTGGSGYFDGNTDWLTAGAASDWTFLHNGSDWTCEFWMYHSGTAVYTIVSTTAFSAQIGMSILVNNTYAGGVVNGLQVYIVDGGGTVADEAIFNSTGLLSINQWNYVAITFTSSTKTCAFTINGASAGSTSNAGFTYSASNPTNTLAIGRYQGSTPGGYLTGYLGSLRISTNVRTSLTSVPTAPYTSDANTKLLCNFTNAGILDNTAKNVLETVGNAQIDTAVVKYGTGSMEFDGTGDYLLLLNNPNLILSGGVYTIEGWIYPNGNYSDYRTIVAKRVASANTTAWQVFLNITNGYLGFYNGTIYLSSTTPTANQWSHVAAVYDGTNMNLYLNGTRVLQTAITNSDVTANIFVGWSGTLNEFFNGFIDDLRITKGIARYTANFVPPVARFPNQ